MRSGWGRDKLGSYWCQLGPKLGPHWKWILWHCDPLHLKQKRKSKISNFTDHFTLLTFIACCKRVCFEFWKWFVLKKRWRDLAARWRSALRNFTKPVGSRNLTIYVFKHNVLESSRQQQLCKSWKSWKRSFYSAEAESCMELLSQPSSVSSISVCLVPIQQRTTYAHVV